MSKQSVTSVTPAPKLTPHLGVWDVAALTAGIIIGAGIFRSPPDIASMTGGPWAMLGMWVLGGLIALVGALCYAELASAFPQQGGTFVYLNQAYHPLIGFLYVWSEFWIVRPGNIGVMAFIFAEYAGEVVRGLNSPVAKLVVACGVVIVLGLVNLLGVRVGKRTQLALTAAKVAGLLTVFVVGMLVIPSGEVEPAAEAAKTSPSQLNPLLAMVFVLFAYGGWNETAAVTAEVRDPQRNMLRGLLLGTAIVVVTYLLVNIALLNGLGFAGVAQGKAVAATLLSRAVGPWGAQAISVLVCVSCLGAINGMLFTGARLYYALGVSHRALAWLGHWNHRLGTPVRALALQCGVAVLLLLILGRQEDKAFQLLVVFTAPVFWTFLLLVSVAVVVLRITQPYIYRPFRLPLFPLEPLIFFAASALMIYSGINYLFFTRTEVGEQSFWFTAGSTILVLGAGVLTYVLTRRPDST